MIEIPERSDDVRVVVLTVGLPGAGKSRWAKKLLKDEPDRWRRVNYDDLRMTMHGHAWSDDRDKEDAVVRAGRFLLTDALDHGRDVVFDNMNINGKYRSEVRKFAARRGDTIVIEKVFEVPLDVVLEQNAMREDVWIVPDDVIRRIAKKAHVDPATGRFKDIKDRIYERRVMQHEFVKKDVTLPKVVVCDVDDTFSFLSDRDPHSAVHMECDKPNLNVIRFLQFDQSAFTSSIHELKNVCRTIVFLTGRPECQRAETEAFISKHCDRYFELYMRPNRDNRPAAIVKHDIYANVISKKYDVELALDDDPAVVRMWKTVGVQCWCVHKPDVVV